MSYLLLAIPGVWAAGYFLARQSTDERLAQVLSVGFGTALWLLAVHIAGLACQSFLMGLQIGSWCVSIPGLIGLAFKLKNLSFRPAFLPPHWRLGGLVVLAATALLAPAAIGWSFHDEQLYTGHLSIASQMLRDIYPPRHLTFPQFELRYHYGFNVLVASLSVILSIGVDAAIDVATLFCWPYTWCLLWALGERLLGPGRGILTAAVTLMGGSLPFLVPQSGVNRVEMMLGLYDIEGLFINPPMVSYFFQHPWTLGLPLGICAILVLIEGRRVGAWHRVGLSVLLLALSLSQFVLFLSLTGAAFAEIFEQRPKRGKHVAAVVLTLVLTSIIAGRLHGFFAPAPDLQGLGISFRLGCCSGLYTTIQWNVLSFGLLLPLGVAGLFLLPRGRLFFGLMITGGLVVSNLFKYEYSWDIVKFVTVAALGLSIPASQAISRAFSLRPYTLGQILGSVLLVGTIAHGVVFLGVFAANSPSIPLSFYSRGIPRLSSEDLQAVRWLQARVRPDELVFRKSQLSLAYAEWGGLPQPFFDGMTQSFGFSKDRLSARERLLKELPGDPDAYLAQGIPWLVLDPGDRRLNTFVSIWLSHGRAKIESQFGQLRIVKILAR